MIRALSRRRFLTISALAGIGAALPAGAAPHAHWHGRAMGAETSLSLPGLDDGAARPVIRAVIRDLTRLERIFSLYRSDSQLVQLNETGVLNAPAAEMVDLLALCDRLHHATGGAFDPTIQPLWQVKAGMGRGISEAAARDLIGWDRVDLAPDRIRLTRLGMALTLNGVAQGYITDRIAALLRARGLRDVLVDMGEIVAMGDKDGVGGWTAAIAAPNGSVMKHIVLKDRALATSAPMGTVLDANAGVGHIVDPRRDIAEGQARLVTVSGPSAAVADGLSTAGCLLDETALSRAIRGFAGTKLEILI